MKNLFIFTMFIVPSYAFSLDVCTLEVFNTTSTNKTVVTACTDNEDTSISLTTKSAQVYEYKAQAIKTLLEKGYKQQALTTFVKEAPESEGQKMLDMLSLIYQALTK